MLVPSFLNPRRRTKLLVGAAINLAGLACLIAQASAAMTL